MDKRNILPINLSKLMKVSAITAAIFLVLALIITNTGKVPFSHKTNVEFEATYYPDNKSISLEIVNGSIEPDAKIVKISYKTQERGEERPNPNITVKGYGSRNSNGNWAKKTILGLKPINSLTSLPLKEGDEITILRSKKASIEKIGIYVKPNRKYQKIKEYIIENNSIKSKEIILKQQMQKLKRNNSS